MDREFAAYLETVKAKRADLGDSMAALDTALAAQGDGVEWGTRLRAALLELAHDLRDHVDVTESEGGLYDDLQQQAPRLSGQVAHQLDEHQDFLDDVDRLLTATEHTEDGPELQRRAARALLDRIDRHRRRGAVLIHEAYAVDIGGMG